jgi:hypothetical protein
VIAIWFPSVAAITAAGTGSDGGIHRSMGAIISGSHRSGIATPPAADRPRALNTSPLGLNSTCSGSRETKVSKQNSFVAFVLVRGAVFFFFSFFFFFFSASSNEH